MPPQPQSTARAAREIDPVIIEPLPAADVDGGCAAGVERMFLGLFFVGGAIVHGLDCCAEE